jgi:hypothetical protein
MVKKGILIVFLLLFLWVAVWVVLFFTGRDQDIGQIRKNLEEVTSLVEKQGDEAPLVSLAGVQKFVSFFADNCQIEVGSPVPGITSKSELMGTVSQLRQSADNIEVKLSEISITLEDNDSARSIFIAKAVVSGSLMEREEVQPRQLDVKWEKIDGSWKIKKVQIVEVLR